ncbi:MAG: hypothetical protein HOP19_29305 [Acidobacteria bacterium]|nr:hypothetical protein [Acidobacteriota bacterium]
MKLKHFNIACLCLLALSLTAFAQQAQRPLITEDVDTVKPGAMRVDFGFDFIQHREFGLSGLQGDLTRVGVVSLTFGLSPNVEFEIGGVIQNYLSVNRQARPAPFPLRLSTGTNSTHDTGDFYLATKFKLRRESKRTPAFGFRFGAEMPNSNQERGIGVNQTNFFATVLTGKHFGKKLYVYGNLGLGILTAPLDRFSQNDVLLYGLAATYGVNESLTLVGEINGRRSTRGIAPRGTESDGAARFGARIKAGGLLWDVAGIRGLSNFSERSGVTFGITYQADVFSPINK